MKLYELPQRTEKGVKIYPLRSVSIEDGKELNDIVILFHHLDGMYSYCTLLDKDGDTVLFKDGTKAVMHLSAATPLKRHADGYKIDWSK